MFKNLLSTPLITMKSTMSTVSINNKYNIDEAIINTNCMVIIKNNYTMDKASINNKYT